MKNRIAMYEISMKSVFQFCMLYNMVFEQKLLLTPKGEENYFILVNFVL